MDSNKCCTYQFATGRITAIISWLGHRFKDTRRHRQSRRSPNKALRKFTDQSKFWVSAQEAFTVVLVVFNWRGYAWKCWFAHRKISNRGALKEKIKAPTDTVNPHLCKCERFLIVEEEVVLLLLIVFPYWAAIQQLGHLVFKQWDLLVNKKLLKTYLVPVY